MATWPGIIVFLFWVLIVVIFIFIVALIISPLGGAGFSAHLGKLFFDIGIRKS